MGTKLIEATPGNFSLLYTDFEHSDLFDEIGFEGGGYDWQSVMVYILETELPDLEDEIDFDSEAGMFCAYGQNKEALAKLGEKMEELIANKAKLKEAISNVPKDYWD